MLHLIMDMLTHLGIQPPDLDGWTYFDLHDSESIQQSRQPDAYYMEDTLTKQPDPPSIDAYIQTFAPDVQAVLIQIHALLKEEVPEAQEKISYKMPTLTLDGRNLIYFAAFKKHIGIYPPVQGDPDLMQELAPYLGEKGNLKFPLSESMPYALIRKVVRARVQVHNGQLVAKARKKG